MSKINFGTIRCKKNTWLTRKPKICTILPDQKVLLKLFVYQFPQYASLFVTIATTNTLGQVVKIQQALGNTDLYLLFQVDASPLRHGFTADIVKMDVYLEASTGGELFSEILTFNIDRNYYNNIRHFFFRNSFGGFDSLQSVGLGSVKESYNRIRATNQIPSRHIRTDRETKTISVDQQLEFKANIGFLNNYGDSNQSWANYVRELYSTLEAYEVIIGEIYPIDILTSDQKLLEDENYLPDFMELEYTRAYVEKGATSEIPALQGSYTNQYTESYD